MLIGMASVVHLTDVLYGRHGSQDDDVIVAAEHGTIEQFASALVRHLPVGVVLLPDDVWTPRVPLVERRTSERSAATIEAALRAFGLRGTPYDVERTAAGGVNLAPRSGSGCAAVARSRGSLTTSGAAFEVGNRIYRAWSKDPSPEIPPGLVGSLSSSSKLFRTVVTVDLIETTLAQAMNAMVEQAPGLGWALREIVVRGRDGDQDPSSVCNLVLFDGRSRLDTSWTFSAVDRR